MEYIEMRKKKTGEDIQVFGFVVDGGSTKAICWDPSLAGRQNGSGFIMMKLNQIIPKNYCNQQGKFISPSSIERERKKIGNQEVKLVRAAFQTADGKIFSNFDSCETVSDIKLRALQHAEELIQEQE